MSSIRSTSLPCRDSDSSLGRRCRARGQVSPGGVWAGRGVRTVQVSYVVFADPLTWLIPSYIRMFLADANLLAIRRLLSRSLFVAHSTTTPGPPLSSSHPSPSLLAKLHLNVYQLYDEARSLVKTASRSNDAHGEVSPQLRRYLSDGRLLSQALSYKWLGVDCGENHSADQTGDALSWLAMSKAALEEIEGKTKGLKSLKIGKGKAAGKGRKTKVQEELDSVAAFTSAYKKVNDTVGYGAGLRAVAVGAHVSGFRSTFKRFRRHRCYYHVYRPVEQR